jgi:hypothetical protein
MSAPEPVAPLVEHFFRHEAGRLVSLLTGLHIQVRWPGQSWSLTRAAYRLGRVVAV